MRASRRTTVVTLIAGSLLGSGLGLAFVGTAAAAPPDAAAAGYDQYGLSVVVAGVRTSGDVGASGGLVTLDSGSAYISARLDSAPSASVLADPYEPGTLARTVAGQVNAQAGQAVVQVPDAEASFPGDGKAALETVPAQTAGPLALRGGAATAEATATSATGTATGAALSVADGSVLEVDGSTSSVKLTADAAAGKVVSTATTRVTRVLVAGVLELRNVVATAGITTDGDTHEPATTLTIGGASVAGQEVAIDNDGVHAVGQPVLPGETLESATKQANGALSQAGISVHTVGATKKATDREAAADTGGVSITVATPDLPGGVAANHLGIVVGGVALTESDQLPLPAVSGPALGGGSGTPGTPGTSVLIPGTPAVPGIAGADGSLGDTPAPQVAGQPRSFVVAGHRLPVSAVLGGFAVWQFATLGMATMYALSGRRRLPGEEAWA